MRKSGILLFCFLLFGLFLGIAGAQEGTIPQTAVSDLEAVTRNNLVRLTWKDSSAAAGPVYIYRSSRPFDASTPMASFNVQRPVEVPYGVESYIDDVESSGRMYYFVAASSGAGDLHLQVIPRVNTLAVEVAGPPEAAAASPQPRGPGGIFGLEIREAGEGVVIRYQTNSGANTMLYRSVKPISHTTDLLSAVIVQSGLSSPFTDYPVPGIPYYYAVIFEDELRRGNVGIYPGYNAAIKPVEVRAERVGLPRAAELRPLPLPLMSLNYAVPGIDNFPELRNPIPLGLNAAKALGSLIRSRETPVPPVRASRAFSQDMETENRGIPAENLALRAIVQGPFARGDWETSRRDLDRYLSGHHSVISEARARFYRGQCLYFSGAWREAFYEFLLIRNYFPVEVNEWLNSCLEIPVNRKL
ncbi:MAG: hypothetical protein LBU19_10720 [Treponema sp.]|jgi:hypothetical protein|nr:hypothetical protein [Treponema sp.]